MNCTGAKLLTSQGQKLRTLRLVLWFQEYFWSFQRLIAGTPKKLSLQAFSQIIRWTLKTNRCRKEDLLLAERLEEDPPTKHLDNRRGTLISKVVDECRTRRGPLLPGVGTGSSN